MVRFFWRIVFFALATSVFAGERLNGLVTAAQDFSVAIQEQLAAVQSDISATQLVEKTASYAKAKTAYYNALRAEMPEMTDIATGRQPRPPDLDKFPTAFSVMHGRKPGQSTGCAKQHNTHAERRERFEVEDFGISSCVPS